MTRVIEEYARKVPNLHLRVTCGDGAPTCKCG